MTWSIFIYFASGAIALTLVAAILALFGKRFETATQALLLVATLLLGAFIIGLWCSLHRPPLKTMGETRLWYAFLLLGIGLISYRRWRYRWIPSLIGTMAAVFCITNILRPEMHDSTLMPALQSIWFVPHVVAYMIAYATLGIAFALSLAGLFTRNRSYLNDIDNLVYLGVGLLTLGMLTGMVWAKEAWGDFWNWDPKETWAAITWCAYLAYIHLRIKGNTPQWLLHLNIVVAFTLLQMCWYGYKWLPASQNSLHIYN